MDYLYGLLASVIGDERWVRLAFLLAVALSVGLAAATVAVLAMGLQDPVRRRMAVIKRGGGWSRGEAPQSGLQLLLEQVGQRFVSQDAGQAAKIGTKLVFPLIFCLWPSFFLVAIGPAMIGVLKAFGRL